jgi:hypothetical protein
VEHQINAHKKRKEWLTQIDTKQHFDVGKVFLLWACPCGSGYLLQVLAALRAFRSYPSRIHHPRFIPLPVVLPTANNPFVFTAPKPSQTLSRRWLCFGSIL